MSKAVANLTQSTETITFSAQDNGETISVNITEAARGPAGSDGPAGPNSVTSTTTSDGTANLSLSNVTTATAEVTGTLTANHIHGNLAGSVYAHVRAGEDLAKGDPVYVSGSHGTGASLIAIVSKADASDGTKMPAIGIMDAALANNASGHMVITGQVYDINTAAYAANAELFVAAGGGLTDSAPLQYAQPVARVERSNTNNGAIIVKVNGLSSLGLPSTLVRRNAAGASSFTSLDIGSAGQVSLSSSGVAIASGTITTSQPLSLTQTWNAAGVTFKGIDVNVTDTASASGSLLMDLRVGGNPYFSIEKDGSTRLYRTYSSSTNFERLNLKYTGTAFQIGTEKGSVGGTARPLEFQTDGTTRMTIGATGNIGIGAAPSSVNRLSVSTSDANNPAFDTSNTGSNTFVPIFESNATNLTAGQSGYIAVGKNRSLKNQFSLLFYYAGNASNSNRLDFTFYGVPILHSVFADGNISLGTTTNSGDRLNVSGKIKASSDIEVTDSASGIILKSPDGTRYRIKVANGGTLTVTAV